MIKKILTILFLLIVILFIIVIILSKLTYSVGGERGYSSSLQESIDRKTFIKLLKYKVIPKELDIKNKVIFIEKGFKYGKNSIYETRKLDKEEFNKYQIIFGCTKPCKKFFDCDYDCDIKRYVYRDTTAYFNSTYNTSLKLQFPNVSDTVYMNILVTSRFKNTIDTIGIIKIWDDKIH